MLNASYTATLFFMTCGNVALIFSFTALEMPKMCITNRKTHQQIKKESAALVTPYNCSKKLKESIIRISFLSCHYYTPTLLRNQSSLLLGGHKLLGIIHKILSEKVPYNEKKNTRSAATETNTPLTKNLQGDPFKIKVDYARLNLPNRTHLSMSVYR